MSDHIACVRTDIYIVLSQYRATPTEALKKDNRILPNGFDKASASWEIAAAGGAATDVDFQGGSDRVRYSIAVADAALPITVTVEFLYQPIAFRWARNLEDFDAPETQRFVRYYDSMAAATFQRLAETVVVVR